MAVILSSTCRIGGGTPVLWDIFDRATSRYEVWYTTPRAYRAGQAERALLAWLLRSFPQVRSVLEVGCGTGHFTAWLVSIGLRVMRWIWWCW